ncbi:MAG: ZPR1 zinc finger domain-containing protein [Euryarchaeota archaeon]|nr:ZPR1 zinc finger domain-containing protein [Euryarchaeota archaeon]MBT3654327.1 ZPR1 zinc finger domain-containing protein [Euryarchaeota archaeon]MBT3757455.1 ZPR1 zinc finger domain-containing protein [Euryarchaeota archaeon]MBT4050547.1 ZPR1 zinc finger domain-containing protein [Euryarchaeota archaeon]MBT4346155.1 ZPR1 zinc finger domain-containing protein [Euryarchaeota archaeon]
MESIIEQPCPICSSISGLTMIVHSSEIPYFGEHTQMTMMCDKCGWRHTDFIPAEGKKPGAWEMNVDSIEKMNVRIVRSSSCTVIIEELGLEVEPGGSSTGYISNIEGVLNRFEDAVSLIYRQSLTDSTERENQEKCSQLLSEINLVKNGELPVKLQLLDPMGHSQILDALAISRELSTNELDTLRVGPTVPVFDADDLI